MSIFRIALITVCLLAGWTARAEPDGEQVFRRSCSVCDTIEPNKTRVGPTLAGVVGRPASSIPDFSYSDANKHSGVVWTPEVLDTYLTNPQAFMPGTRMTFPGLEDPADRQAVINFLRLH
jgi:cytochrome c